GATFRRPVRDAVGGRGGGRPRGRRFEQPVGGAPPLVQPARGEQVRRPGAGPEHPRRAVGGVPGRQGRLLNDRRGEVGPGFGAAGSGGRGKTTGHRPSPTRTHRTPAASPPAAYPARRGSPPAAAGSGSNGGSAAIRSAASGGRNANSPAAGAPGPAAGARARVT